MSISDVQNTSIKDVIKSFILAPQWTPFQRLQRYKKTSTGRNFAQWEGISQNNMYKYNVYVCVCVCVKLVFDILHILCTGQFTAVI